MPRAEAVAAAWSAVRRSKERRQRREAPEGPAGPRSPSEPGSQPGPQHGLGPGGGIERHEAPRTERWDRPDADPPSPTPDPVPSPSPASTPSPNPTPAPSPARESAPDPVPSPDPEPAPALSARERWGLALADRMPVWLRVRCGMEPKTLVALCLVLLVGLGFAVHHFWTGRPQGVPVPAVSGPTDPSGAPGEASAPPGESGAPSTAPVAGGAAPSGRLVVDVSGKVREPGLQQLPAGSRVADALEAAGGLRKGADTEGLNQARRLVDGEQIVVGESGRSRAAGGAVPGGGAPGAGSAVGPSGAMVSLNSANREQLETLPGVGPVLAQHIVDYRTQHGGFRSVDQLKEVNGIGEKRFADIRPQVTP